MAVLGLTLLFLSIANVAINPTLLIVIGIAEIVLGAAELIIGIRFYISKRK